jgi:uncharacterized damage-inducible protein DinB
MPKPGVSFDLRSALVSAFRTNDRINHFLIENIPAEAWSAKPPEGKGRTIQAIAIHIHNVRLMWLKAVGAGNIPAKLEESATAKEALKALGDSCAALVTVLESGLETGQVKGFKPDAAGFFSYLISHDSHHRGQMISLARRLGHPVSQSAGFGMWEWGSRSKEV